ncbi:hypothetical protein LPB41_15605 [Thalassospira sp. MA62]|nr:hypothetical protein [Thalassospira sp. MA62]
MGTWIEQHATMLQVGVNVATLMIWIFYAQLLFQNYRRARRPKIVINQMLGKSEKARFLISNMSQEAIHIERVLVCVGSDEDQICEQVTDIDPDEDGDETDEQKSSRSARLDEVTLQGPLESGRCIELGSLKKLLGRMSRRAQRANHTGAQRANHTGAPGPKDDEDIWGNRIEITVIGVYSSENGVIGASRAFVRDENGDLRPEQIQTTQHAGIFERRRMGQLHAKYV